MKSGRKVTTRHVAEDAALIGHQLLSPMPHMPGLNCKHERTVTAYQHICIFVAKL